MGSGARTSACWCGGTERCRAGWPGAGLRTKLGRRGRICSRRAATHAVTSPPVLCPAASASPRAFLHRSVHGRWSTGAFAASSSRASSMFRGPRRLQRIPRPQPSGLASAPECQLLWRRVSRPFQPQRCRRVSHVQPTADRRAAGHGGSPPSDCTSAFQSRLAGFLPAPPASRSQSSASMPSPVVAASQRQHLPRSEGSRRSSVTCAAVRAPLVLLVCQPPQPRSCSSPGCAAPRAHRPGPAVGVHHEDEALGLLVVMPPRPQLVGAADRPSTSSRVSTANPIVGTVVTMSASSRPAAQLAAASSRPRRPAPAA